MAKKHTSEEEKKVEIPLVIPKKKRGRPIANRQHQIVTTYAEEIPLDELDRSEEDDEVVKVEIEPAEEAISDDSVERFVREIQASSSRWEIIVYRLPNFDIDGRTDVRAPYRERVGKIPFNPQSYEDEITTLFARPGLKNVFVCEVRKDGIYHAILPVVRTAPPSPQEMPALYSQPTINAAAPPAAIIQPQPSAPPIDPFEQLNKSLDLLAKMRKALPEPEPPPQVIQPQINTTEQALLTIMNADGALIDNVASRLKGLMRPNSDKEITVMDLIMAAIQADTLPKMLTEAKKLIMEVRQVNGQAPMDSQTLPTHQTNHNPQSANGRDHQLGQNGQTQTIAQGGAHQAQSEQPGISAGNNPALQPEAVLLNQAINACAINAPLEGPDSFADWVIAFEKVNPSTGALLDLFVGMSADQAMTWLLQTTPLAAPIVSLPHTREWIEKLQKALIEEGDDKETEQATSN